MSLQQGQELMSQGEKLLNKKSFFGKATPDYDLARPLFEQAAVQFKAAKATLLAVSAHSKAAECYKQQNALFLAGKQFESAALLVMNDKQLNQQSEAARLFKAAGDLFVMYGNSEKGAEVVEKAGRCLEDTDVNRAIEYYNDAISLYDTDGKPRSAIDTYGRFISFLARHKQWGQAVENSDKLVQLFRKLDNHPSYNRQVLTTTLLVLLSGDSVDARKRLNAYEEFQGFYDSDEGEISHQLVESFETYDDELLANVLKRPNIKYLDNEIARASLALRIPGSGKSAAAPQPQYNAPQQQFNIPQNFGAPQQYGAPPQGFNPPLQQNYFQPPQPQNAFQPPPRQHSSTTTSPYTSQPNIARQPSIPGSQQPIPARQPSVSGSQPSIARQPSLGRGAAGYVSPPTTRQPSQPGLNGGSGSGSGGSQGHIYTPPFGQDAHVYTPAFQQGQQDGHVYTPAFPQGQQDGHAYTPAFPQGQQDGHVYTPQFPGQQFGSSGNLGPQQQQGQHIYTPQFGQQGQRAPVADDDDDLC
ncbi:hypothetical protein HDU79_005881 [Rhizoclosmatium sp. JEL0117]|nr:hypothetical protein HDU79_005881 [Rhizoclosmatium sp. JEL0117]